MRAVIMALFDSVLSFVRSRRAAAPEIVALRHQLAVLRRQTKRPRLTNTDRMLWIAFRRLWPKWERALVLVKPATVIGWHRAGFRAYWRWKSRPKGGRPKVDPEVRKLIRQMWLSNPTWGRPRIQAELAKLGIQVSESTVRKYQPRRRKPPPFDTAPRFLIRDRDGIYGAFLRKRIGDLGIEQVVTAYRSPWQNPCCERLLGTIRRDCLDQVIVWNEAHLRRTLREFFRYYHEDRTHQGLENDCPESRPMEPPSAGNVIELPRIGGLHHRYVRRAA